jgi:hypothetical protein
LVSPLSRIKTIFFIIERVSCRKFVTFLKKKFIISNKVELIMEKRRESIKIPVISNNRLPLRHLK